MQALEPTETLDPPGSVTLDPKTLPESQPQTPAAMPQELRLGLEAEPPAGGGEGIAVGDFVWGKSRSFPWWPGRVHDPLEASDYTKKSPCKDRSSVLVAYFGDGSFAWCNPSQIKPFFEVFDEFGTSSSSKSFRAALDSAVSEVGMFLEAQLSCNCLPEEEKSKLRKYLGNTEKISNFLVKEFLGLVKDVAVDVTVVNAVEIAKLRSWAVAFERGVHVGHKRKAVSELVDKIDLDVPAAEAIEGPEISKGPEVLSEKNDRGRKKRSMAVLIAQMDLDSVELSDDDSEEKESGQDLEIENANAGGGVKEEVGPGRRERKKSKYLSPPYCYLSGGIARSLMSPKSSEPKTLKSPRGLFSGSAVGKYSTEGLDKEEDEKSGSLFQVDGLDAKEVLSEFLTTAVNPLHLKWNRLAKMVRGFFSEFRSSLYSRGAKFDSYQKLLIESVGTDGKIVNKEMGDKSEESNKTEVKKGGKGKDIVNGEGETLIVKSEEAQKTEEKRERERKDIVNGEVETLVDKSEDGKKTGSKSGRKRKDKINDERLAPIDLSHRIDEDKAVSETGTLTEGIAGNILVTPKRHMAINSEDSTSGHKRGRKRKADVNQSITVNLASESVNHVELREPEQGQTKGEVVANGKPPAELDIESHSQMKQATKGQKRKNIKDGSIVDVTVNLGSKVASGSGEENSRQRKKNKKSKVTSGSGEGKSRQRKNNKNSTSHEDPAAIMLTFSPGSSLPTKDDLISAFSKYGPVMQSETEVLQESSSAKIVFGRSSDAEKAFNDKLAALGLPVANYRLHYLTGNGSSPPSIAVPKPPLPYIRKSLERMISTLSGSSLEKIAGATSEGLKPETRDNLVGEMQGLLMKVDKMLTGPSPGTSS